MDDLLSEFLSETSDHIDGIATYLVLFEQDPSDSDAVTQIFRLVHTIKGTSGFLGLSNLQAIAHAAETLIDTLRDGAPPTGVAVSLLLESMDRIKNLLSRVAELGEEPADDHGDIISRIEAYLAPGGADEVVVQLTPEPVSKEAAPAAVAGPENQPSPPKPPAVSLMASYHREAGLARAPGPRRMANRLLPRIRRRTQSACRLPRSSGSWILCPSWF